MVFTVGGPGRFIQRREVQVGTTEEPSTHTVVEWSMDTPFHVINGIGLIDLTMSIRLRNKWA